MSWGADHPFVAMPLGGIGTGSLALGSDGGLRQFQLQGVGNHRGDLPGTFLALRTMQHVPVHDSTVILQAARDDPGAHGRPATVMVDDDLVPAWQKDLVDRHGGTQTRMEATYPVAEVHHDTGGPVEVTVRALNPLVPGDLEDSGIPTAMLEVTLTNTTDVVTRTWLAHGVHNAVGLDPHTNPRGTRAFGYGGNTNRLRRHEGRADLVMDNPAVDPSSPWAGQMALGCQADQVVALPCFTEPDELVDFLRLLAPWGDHSRHRAADWMQAPQASAPALRYGPSPDGQTWLGALVAFTELQPHQSRTVRFALTWWFPNRMVDFVQFGSERPEVGATQFWLGNHYTRRWPDAVAVLDDVMARWDQLRDATDQWVQVMRNLPLPEGWRTHLATQPIPLRTPTSLRTADGTCYGFEGVLGASTRMWSGDVGGSCPMNCTHVWNYAQAASALFPEWEASMRDTEFDVMQAPSGALPHRVHMPPWLPQYGDGFVGGPEAPALDGMCGSVLKTYRELRRGAVNLTWLERRWPRILALLEHIQTTWDPERTGVLRGIQPSTHDIHLHGVNTFMGTLWLAALRAAEEMALLLDQQAQAAGFREVFEAGTLELDRICFAGDYYVQVPEQGQSLEHQWATGCLADQLVGQWWAHQLDLGYVLPEAHVKQALRSVVAHNLVDDPDARGQRAYALAGERGLLMATWPHGDRPELPTMYSDEVWTGSEYQVAAHCLFEGLGDEATAVLEALWSRHDGTRRNPFNEVECGDHYARAMAGWSVVEAGLGLRWNQLTGELVVGHEGVAPVLTGSGWGEIRMDHQGARIRCHRGVLPLRTVVGPTSRYAVEAHVSPEMGWIRLDEAT